MNRKDRRIAAKRGKAQPAGHPINGAYEVEPDHWVTYENGRPTSGTIIHRDATGTATHVDTEHYRHIKDKT